MKLKYSLFIIILCLKIKISNAQFTIVGQDKFSTNWHEIDTNNISIIFPLEKKKLAESFYKFYKLKHLEIEKSFDVNAKKIPIILHQNSVISNGFVTVAPFRSEFYLTSPQDQTLLSWEEELFIHEYRHIVQFSKIYKSTPKIFNFLFGDLYNGFISGILLNLWMFEGDAVLIETALTPSGRGRQPNFELKLRANLLENKFYNYSKAKNNSYKNFIPNHYELGYHLVTMMRKDYGQNIISDIYSNISSQKKYFTVTNYLKKTQGIKLKHLYLNKAKILADLWKKQDSLTIKTSYQKISKEKKYYTNYNFPIKSGDNLYALKNGLDDISQIVNLTKNEKKIFDIGTNYNSRISGNENYLVWEELRYDPRWTHSSFSEIVLYDLKKNTKKNISKNSKYFTPFISKNNKIVTIENKSSIESSIILMDIKGNIKKKISISNDEFISFPVFSEDEKFLYFIKSKNYFQYISKFNIETEKEEVLFSTSQYNIQSLFSWKDKIFFRYSGSGIENIFTLDLNTNSVYQVTSSKYGAFSPFVSNDSILYYSNYTTNGYEIVSTKLNFDSLIPLNEVENHSPKLYENITNQEKESMVDNLINKSGDSFPEVKKYNRLKNSFNFHSRVMPIDFVSLIGINNPNFYIPNIGGNIYSQNILSSFVSIFGYFYNPSQNTQNLNMNFQFLGLYNPIGISYDFKYFHNLSYQLHQINLYNYIPFNFSRNSKIIYYEPRVSFNILLGKYEKENELSNFYTLGISQKFYLQKQIEKRRIYPEYGINLEMGYKIVNSLDYQYLNVNLGFYLPSPINNQGLYSVISYQEHFTKQSNLILGDGKYPLILNSSFNPNYPLTISTKYAIPLINPDLNLGTVFYLKRVNLFLFYETTLLQKKNIDSFGGILTFKFHLFNLLTPITFSNYFIYSSTLESFKYNVGLSFSLE